MGARMPNWLVMATAAEAVVVLDQLTKYWIRTRPDWQFVELIPGWLSFHYTDNPGLAMGIDWFETRVVSLLSIAATIAIFAYVWRHLKQAPRGYALLMGLVFGGALGNIIDRLVLAWWYGYGGVLEGHVTDFIHITARVGDWPVFPYIFNVADMAITCSVVVLLVFSKKLMPEAPRVSGDPAPPLS